MLGEVGARLVAGRAIVMRSSWTDRHYRRGFDVQLPLSGPNVMNFTAAERRAAQRDLLLFFKVRVKAHAYCMNCARCAPHSQPPCKG